MLQLESGKAWVVRNSISSDESQSESHNLIGKMSAGILGQIRCAVAAC